MLRGWLLNFVKTALESFAKAPRETHLSARRYSLQKMLRVALLCLACTASEALRAAVAPMGARTLSRAAVRAEPAVMQFGKKKKSTEELLEEKGYWPGEWVCADCGYIYEPSADRPFEELRPRWKCPQCAGPRRRFVKKAGGVTAQINDSPLIYGTAAVAVVTAVLVYLGLTI